MNAKASTWQQWSKQGGHAMPHLILSQLLPWSGCALPFAFLGKLHLSVATSHVNIFVT